MQPVLSICICSLQSRIGMLGALRRELEDQIERNNAHGLVEVIINLDNKEKSTGKKRQELLEQAKGKYIVYIDDDDSISNEYLSEMIKALKHNPDCVGYCGWMTTNGSNPITWRISKDYDNITVHEGGKKVYLRHTNHITAVRRELALQAGFNDVSNAEDKYYSDRLRGLLKTEYKVCTEIYHYKFSTHNKEYK